MEKLGINWVQLAAQLLNVGLLILILKKFLYKPVLHMLERRRAQIEENDRLSKDLKDREERLTKREKELERDAKDKALQVIRLSEKEARNHSEELLKRAEERAKQHEQELVEAAKDRQKSLLKEVDREVVKRATELANRSLSSILGPDMKQKITQREIEKLLGKQ